MSEGPSNWKRTLRQRARAYRSAASRVSILIGVVLFVSTALGHFTRLGAFESGPPRRAEMLDMALVEKTRSLDALYSATQQQTETSLSDLQPAEAMRILHETVSRRFSHFDKAYHSFFSNWLMWGAGTVLRPLFPSLGTVHSPDLLLKYGHSALCGSQSYTLLLLAERAGIPARLRRLTHHVVLEVAYDDEWHMYDPDFEIIGGLPDSTVLSVEELRRNPSLLVKLYEGELTPEEVLAVYHRTETKTDSFSSWIPVDTKARYLLVIEQVAELLKFALPLLMVLIGWWLSRLAKRQAVRSSLTE
jgi:hypothetical protein